MSAEKVNDGLSFSERQLFGTAIVIFVTMILLATFFLIIHLCGLSGIYFNAYSCSFQRISASLI
uniref:Uncharacterized protein n=1 Tax=Heterorhabditis bacteriophora TaxID=37862 RepID=A0A1I7XHM3_HETBA